jgi:RNA polymerase sigma-70 factor (ECF subfamily)
MYDKHAANLVLYGRALGLSHTEAEDVLHDTFLALLKLAAPPEQAQNYLLRAFRNRTLNYRRSVWRRLTRELESQRWFEPTESDSLLEEQAVRCLNELPVDQREAIVLRLWHGLTHEAIGELLGASPNTVAARYRYGLRRIRSVLERHGYERVREFGESVALARATTPIPRA